MEGYEVPRAEFMAQLTEGSRTVALREKGPESLFARIISMGIFLGTDEPPMRV